MSKILITGEGPYPIVTSGYAKYNTEMGAQLVEAGHEVYMMVTRPVFVTEMRGIKILNPNFNQIENAGIALMKWSEQIKQDITIFTGDWWVIAAYAYCDLPGKKYAFIWIDGEPLPEQAGFIFDIVDRIFTPTHHGVKVCRQSGFSASYAPPRIDTEIFKPIELAEDKMIDVGCVCRFMQRKGIETLLTAISKVPDVRLYLHLDVHDPAAPFDLKEAGKSLGLINRIALTNTVRVPDEIMGSLVYPRMRVHALLSHGEGFGLPIMESMACGIPNIVLDREPMTEIIGNAGFKVKVADTYINNAGVEWARGDSDDAALKIQEALAAVQETDIRQKCADSIWRRYTDKPWTRLI